MHKLAKIVLATFFTGSSSVAAFGQATDTNALIKAAVLPLPEPLRAGATVFNYEPEGTYTLLRKGSNDMVCIHEPGEGGDSGEAERSFRKEAERHSGMNPNAIRAYRRWHLDCARSVRLRQEKPVRSVAEEERR